MFSVYWRTILAISLLILCCGLIQPYVNILLQINNSNYYPTVFCLLMALVFFISTFIQPNGLVFVFWGKRVGLHTAFWRHLNNANALLFVALSILAIIVYASVDKHIWGYYKLFAQPIMFIFIPLIYTRKLLANAKTY